MNWIKENWPVLKFVIASILIILGVQQAIARAKWKGEALVHQQRVEHLDTTIDSMKVANVTFRDSLKIQDSIRIARNRDDSIAMETAQRERRAASHRADSLSANLEQRLAQVDTALSAQFDEYKKSMEVQLAKSDSTAATYLRRALRAENELLFANDISNRKDNLINTQAEQIIELKATVEVQNNALNPPMFKISIGSDWWKFVIGFAGGVLATR